MALKPLTTASTTLSYSASPSIKLGLGFDDVRCQVIRQESSSYFTAAQLHELQQQALIFNHIISGLAVPFHLVFPIWKSVAISFGVVSGEINNQYQSLIRFNPQGFDYWSTMNLEPWRCRRTDGKKWRCSRNVIQDQKYCERHMHRGRQRSRKHVEASKNILESNKTKIIKSSNITNTNTNPSVSIPTNLQLTIPSSNTGNNVTNAVETITTSSTGDYNVSNKVDNSNDSSATPLTINFSNRNKRSKNNVGGNRDITITPNTCIGGDAEISDSRNNSSYVDGKDANFNHTNEWMVKRSSSAVITGNVGSFVSSRFVFSPKSVLQGDTVTGCSSSGFHYTALVETDLQRCRRTDGKKWRCRRDVIPNQKYCQKHMHRGAKKPLVASESPTIDMAGRSSSITRAVPIAIPKKLDLNTNLSISITATPRQTADGETCSTSDATTITDEHTNISSMFALSP